MAKLLGTILLGCLITWLSLRGCRAVDLLMLPQRMQSLPESMIAYSVLENPKSELNERQQAIALLIGNDASLYVKIDNELSNEFSKRVGCRGGRLPACP